jgi:hypothetical protein
LRSIRRQIAVGEGSEVGRVLGLARPRGKASAPLRASQRPNAFFGLILAVPQVARRARRTRQNVTGSFSLRISSSPPSSAPLLHPSCELQARLLPPLRSRLPRSSLERLQCWTSWLGVDWRARCDCRPRPGAPAAAAWGCKQLSCPTVFGPSRAEPCRLPGSLPAARLGGTSRDAQGGTGSCR